MDIASPGLLIGFLLIFPIALFYKKKQDSNQLGGNIAYAKALWLCYCIFAWFILPLSCVQNFLNSQTLSAFQFSILCFGLSFYLRGFAELYMLYVTKNWKPLYGVTHNISSFILVFGLTIFYLKDLMVFEKLHMVFLLLSLCFETYYALFFMTKIGNKTEGEEAIWFANTEDPLFKRNLQVTRIGNTILFVEMIIFLIYV